MSLFWAPYRSDPTTANYAAASADRARSTADEARESAHDSNERLDQLFTRLRRDVGIGAGADQLNRE